MRKQSLNKIRNPFLEASFPENPLPYKRLNRKAMKASTRSNKTGLTKTIRNIKKNIIDKQTVFKTVEKTSFKNLSYTSLLSKRRFLSPKMMSMMYAKKQKEHIRNISRVYRKPLITKYMFSLDQLKAEFQKKQSQYRKSSNFKNMLSERKKCSMVYGSLGEKQMQKLIEQAKHFDGKFDENFIKIIESRLDVTLYRICFFCNVFSAKQWISHGHILVNKKVIYIPSYQLKGGDVISISPDKKNLLKKNISFLIAQKVRIRSLHYFVKIKSFYTIVKNLVKYQNKSFSLYYHNKNLLHKSFDEKQRAGNIKNYTHFEDSRKFVLFLKKSLHTIKKSVYKYKMYNSLYLLPKIYPFFSLFVSQKTVNPKHHKVVSVFYPFLKVRNLFTSIRPLKQRMKSLKISGMKPLNIEVCYKNMVAIFLYSPQKVALPVTIDLHLIAKSAR